MDKKPLLTDLPKVSFVSLGCPKNLVDSEVMLGGLAKRGFAICEDFQDSDIVIVNTCGFLGAAEKESLGVVGEMVALKKQGKIRGVIVAGCLPQRRGNSLNGGLDGVDAVMGVGDRHILADLCADILKKDGDMPVERRYEVREQGLSRDPDRDRLRLTPRHYAYIRISEGCDHTCAFCIIPKIRGRFRSKPIDMVVGEVRELAADGAREINIISQDTTSYGIDIERRTLLPELVNEISRVEGVDWIRLLYCYPTHVTDRLIETIRDNPKVVKYIDMPIQHTSERMLRLMRRGITVERQTKLIGDIRRMVPGVVIRTSVIVGFPGETPEDHEDFLNAMRIFRFERLGAFKFSREEGTPAYSMEEQVPQGVMDERYHAVMSLQQEIAFERNKNMIGKNIEAIIDRKGTGKNEWEGRTYGDAPDIDGKIVVRGKSLRVGAICRVKVTGVSDYDLVGERS